MPFTLPSGAVLYPKIGLVATCAPTQRHFCRPLSPTKAWTVNDKIGPKTTIALTYHHPKSYLLGICIPWCVQVIIYESKLVSFSPIRRVRQETILRVLCPALPLQSPLRKPSDEISLFFVKKRAKNWTDIKECTHTTPPFCTTPLFCDMW